MFYEVNIKNRTSTIELINKEENKVKLILDGKEYEFDIVMIEEGVYSIIKDGVSYNVELMVNGSIGIYTVNTPYDSFEIEVVDSNRKYQKSRKKSDGDDSDVISTPMPGKVIKILVKEGDKVKAGETVVIISAMKMESEYKVKKDRIIKEILVKEGDIIDGHQPLIYVE